MTKDTLIDRLLALPLEIASAERAVIEADARKRQAVALLEDREAGLLVEGIEGKNEAIRAAALRQMTASERLLVEEADTALTLTRALFNHLKTEHSSLRVVGRLFASSENGD